MRHQREAPTRRVTVCIAQASAWLRDFAGVAGMFVVCGPVIFSLSSNTAAMSSSAATMATMSLAAAAP